MKNPTGKQAKTVRGSRVDSGGEKEVNVKTSITITMTSFEKARRLAKEDGFGLNFAGWIAHLLAREYERREEREWKRAEARRLQQHEQEGDAPPVN